MITLKKKKKWDEFLIAIQTIWTSEGTFVTSLQAIGENRCHLICRNVMCSRLYAVQNKEITLKH